MHSSRPSTSSIEFPSSKATRPLLMLVFSDHGGLADYAHAQAAELAHQGHDPIILCKRRFTADRPTVAYRRISLFISDPKNVQPKLLRNALQLLTLVANEWLAALVVLTLRPSAVLKDGYYELLSPIWFLPHFLLDRLLGIPYAVTLHDPDRKKVLGPGWWHRLSLRAAYSMIRVGLVHDLSSKGLELAPKRVLLTKVPHGIFDVSAKQKTRAPDSNQLRAELGIPCNKTLLLSFGFIADRKNLDLAIRALAERPNICLLIAGRVASSRDRQVSYYRNLAQELQVEERVFFVERFVDDREIPSFFSAADIVLLTYSAEFVSQSGILHLAANWDKPVLASSGHGPLTETVQNYNIGTVVEPDSVEALVHGLQQLVEKPSEPLGWDQFRKEASWTENVNRLLKALSTLNRGQSHASAH